MRLRLHVKLEVEEIAPLVAALPGVGERSIYRLERRGAGFDLLRRASRRRYEDLEMVRQILRVRCRAGPRRGVTEVRARFVQRPNAASTGASTVKGPSARIVSSKPESVSSSRKNEQRSAGIFSRRDGSRLS